MHLNKILDQIKHHPSPTEAIDKLGKALEKHELKYDEEMRRCEDILKLLNTTPDITTNVTKDFKELDELKAEVKELKQLLQNVTTVRPEVNEKVPQAEEKQIEI